MLELLMITIFPPFDMPGLFIISPIMPKLDSPYLVYPHVASSLVRSRQVCFVMLLTLLVIISYTLRVC